MKGRLMERQRIRHGAPWRELVEDVDGCLLWRGQIDRDGYGVRSGQLAHRRVYEAEVGPIPAGLTLDHLCRVRACVNPEHLEPVTRSENILRGNTFQGINSRKTHCPQGHEYTPENTYLQVRARDGGVSRSCLTCRRLRARQSEAAR